MKGIADIQENLDENMSKSIISVVTADGSAQSQGSSSGDTVIAKFWYQM